MFDIRESNYYKLAPLIHMIEIVDKDAAGAFLSVMSDPNVNVTPSSDAGVDGAFIWGETQHGSSYWYQVHVKVSKHFGGRW